MQSDARVWKKKGRQGVTTRKGDHRVAHVSTYGKFGQIPTPRTASLFRNAGRTGAAATLRFQEFLNQVQEKPPNYKSSLADRHPFHPRSHVQRGARLRIQKGVPQDLLDVQLTDAISIHPVSSRLMS